jgi:hypothetical protein
MSALPATYAIGAGGVESLQADRHPRPAPEGVRGIPGAQRRGAAGCGVRVSAAPITKSQVKLASWAESRRRDRLAREIMEREGISFSEAYLRVLNAISRWNRL